VYAHLWLVRVTCSATHPKHTAYVTDCNACAGKYATNAGYNDSCLVYVTFNDRIIVYHNLELERVATSNVLAALQEDFQHSPALNEMRTNKQHWSFEEQTSIIHRCLQAVLPTSEQSQYYAVLQEKLARVCQRVRERQ
jgi:hypothetical protein